MPKKKYPIIPYSGSIISRAEAKEQGLRRYFTGLPCLRGHLAEKITKSGSCIICVRILSLNTYYKDVEINRTHLRERARKNRDKKIAWNKSNADRIRKNSQEWAKANPQKRNAIRRNRVARELMAIGRHTAEDVELIKKAQKNKCALCSISLRSVKWQVDHIIPLSRGGHNGRSNLQVLCTHCNRSKGGKDPIEHSRHNGRLL